MWRCSDESDHGKDPWHEAGSVQQGTQQDGVDARHEAPSERERPVVGRDVRRADGDQRGRIGSGRCAQVLVQGHEVLVVARYGAGK